MKLLSFPGKRLCSRIYAIHKCLEQCGKNVSIFRNGLLENTDEYYILHNHILQHVVIFPEDIPDEDIITTMGVVE